MPELSWNKIDFIECLGVMPESEEYETYFGYTVARNRLLLLITVRPYESVIELRLRRDNTSNDIISFALLVEGNAGFKSEKWGDYLLLTSCRVISDRFYYMREEGAASVSQNTLFNVEIAVDPDIRITFDD